MEGQGSRGMSIDLKYIILATTSVAATAAATRWHALTLRRYLNSCGSSLAFSGFTVIRVWGFIYNLKPSPAQGEVSHKISVTSKKNIYKSVTKFSNLIHTFMYILQIPLSKTDTMDSYFYGQQFTKKYHFIYDTVLANMFPYYFPSILKLNTDQCETPTGLV